ncbi:hypothetical protein TK45_09350 [Bowmanella sp. JS7-9]|nr:hypothetical protein TK45_09350 [Bowmanella sp. JS7-9]
MTFKFKHYAAKTAAPLAVFNTDLFLMSLSFGLISAVFSYAGFHSEVPQLAYPCLILSVGCWIIFFYVLVSFIIEKVRNR